MEFVAPEGWGKPLNEVELNLASTFGV